MNEKQVREYLKLCIRARKYLDDIAEMDLDTMSDETVVNIFRTLQEIYNELSTLEDELEDASDGWPEREELKNERGA